MIDPIDEVGNDTVDVDVDGGQDKHEADEVENPTDSSDHNDDEIGTAHSDHEQATFIHC